ncbi:MULTISPECIES: hypothetical protein [Zhongshania]|jgi:hypothetical protein|uniref:Uncharacterized protein n=1 Tax=Zhongshania aquimaris TaxID=2857107 RepID=A0ABS6VTC4_9GAMM|nr:MULTISPECIES: hypothetical protein [Zhongshania]MBQ0796352.1 hypothetical protein [Zhongshania sp.]MBW2941551.1 hypothetical protein [Zhongshania aquimaris]|tara:strand:- start:505 stop:873 length:369 start_codon:yes stop_codon:yes gene_type:complete
MVYSPEMVTLLQQLRARIFAEFGTKIRLADPQLLPSLGDIGKRSRDPFTRKTVVEIMSLAGIPFQLETATKPVAKDINARQATEVTYRGTKIYRDKELPAQSQVPAERQQTRQMYRGQVVYK